MRALFWCLLLCPELVWADVYVIYRPRDQVIAGYAYTEAQVAVEQQNILVSEGFSGATADEFAVKRVPQAAWDAARDTGQLSTMVNNNVVFIPNPEDAVRVQTSERLRLKLGLTVKEFQDLKDALR